VAWDRGHSGRKDVSPDYKAQRTSRPDLLKEQWPAFEPLVEAFGILSAAAAPFLEQFGTEIAGIVVEFSNWVKEG
jgi:DNA polymerase-1